MKKTIATVLIIVSVLCCSFAFIGCKKNQDNAESFVGAVSKTTYESKEDAVKGFLDEELSGDAYSLKYIGYTKTTELSQKEIDKLALDDVDKEGIVSVEKGEVEYSEISNSEMILIKLASETCKRVVYIITYNRDGKVIYRFYVVDCEVGQIISKSYLHSVLSGNKYENCTIKFFNGDGFVQIKYTKDGIFSCEIDGNGKEVENDWGNYIYYSKSYLYLISVGNGKVDEIYRIGKLTLNEFMNLTDNYDKIEEFEIDFYQMPEEVGWYQISSFFGNIGRIPENPYMYVRTEKGFDMKPKFVQLLFEHNRKVSATVKNGRITYIDFGYDTSDWKEWDPEWDANISLSDFGKTKFEIPQIVIDAVNNYESNF